MNFVKPLCHFIFHLTLSYKDIKGEMKTVNHQPMTYCGFALQRTSLTIMPPPSTALSLMTSNFE